MEILQKRSFVNYSAILWCHKTFRVERDFCIVPFFRQRYISVLCRPLQPRHLVSTGLGPLILS